MTGTPTTRVLIVDDDPAVHLMLTRILARMGGFEIVGQATDGQEALRLAADVGADVIVMDHKMPKLTGLDATRRLRKLGDDTPVLIFSSEEKVANRLGRLKNVCFLSKGRTTHSELVAAIRSMGRVA